MTPTEESTGSQTATPGTEHTLVDTAVAGIRVIAVDVSALTGAEVATIKAYVKVPAAGTYKVAAAATFAAGSTEPNTLSIPIVSAGSTKFTLTQTGGTGRVFPWSSIRIG